MRLTKLAFAAPVLALAACATPHPGSMDAAVNSDRYEKFNRSIYSFNRGLDRYALKPVTQVYRAVTPEAARRGVSNAFQNTEEPLSFVNAILQGKIKQAFRTLDRFLINTTLGVGGLADNATDLGRPEEPEDFGQTLAVWGVKSGPYLMLPLLGPSTLRDAAGFGVDLAADPFDYARNAALHPTFVAKVGIFGARTIDLRSRIIDAGGDNALSGSLDEYATIKSAYLQRRQSQIYDGNPPLDDEDLNVPAAAPVMPPAAPGSPATATPVAPAPPAPPR